MGDNIATELRCDEHPTSTAPSTLAALGFGRDLTCIDLRWRPQSTDVEWQLACQTNTRAFHLILSNRAIPRALKCLAELERGRLTKHFQQAEERAQLKAAREGTARVAPDGGPLTKPPLPGFYNPDVPGIRVLELFQVRLPPEQSPAHGVLLSDERFVSSLEPVGGDLPEEDLAATLAAAASERPRPPEKPVAELPAKGAKGQPKPAADKAPPPAKSASKAPPEPLPEAPRPQALPIRTLVVHPGRCPLCDTDLIEISRHCPFLRHLSIGGRVAQRTEDLPTGEAGTAGGAEGGGITNQGLEELAFGCRELRTLRLSRCGSINRSKGVIALATQCKKLEWLEITDAPLSK
eukprot:jgi/Mesvir1/28038/Mv04643-RA.1